MAERDWKECDLCNKEVFTKKDADGFISICPECREQDEKRLEQLAELRKELEFKNDVVGDRDKQIIQQQDNIKELEERKSWKAQCDECKRLGKLGTLEKENAILKAKLNAYRNAPTSATLGIAEKDNRRCDECPMTKHAFQVEQENAILKGNLDAACDIAEQYKTENAALRKERDELLKGKGVGGGDYDCRKGCPELTDLTQKLRSKQPHCAKHGWALTACDSCSAERVYEQLGKSIPLSEVHDAKPLLKEIADLKSQLELTNAVERNKDKKIEAARERLIEENKLIETAREQIADLKSQLKHEQGKRAVGINQVLIDENKNLKSQIEKAKKAESKLRDKMANCFEDESRFDESDLDEIREALKGKGGD